MTTDLAVLNNSHLLAHGCADQKSRYGVEKIMCWSATFSLELGSLFRAHLVVVEFNSTIIELWSQFPCWWPLFLKTAYIPHHMAASSSKPAKRFFLTSSHSHLEGAQPFEGLT